MASRIIPPFPGDIDRDAFGHWLSGFCDGEATFAIVKSAKRGRTRTDRGMMSYRAVFAIGLRDDDLDILRTVQSFLGCGYIQLLKNLRSKIPNAKPVARFRVDDQENAVGIIVPNFERYPLRAKKRQDFIIWSEAARMLWERKKRKTKTKIGRTGTLPKWSDAEHERFLLLWSSLREQREYRSAPIARGPVMRPPDPEQGHLF